MASEDDLVSKLIFETPSSPQLQQFNALLETNRKQIEYVQAAMVSVNAPTAAYRARLNDLLVTESRLILETNQLNAAQSAHARTMLEEEAAARKSFVTYQMFSTGGSRFAAGMNQAGEGTNRFARGLLQLGYVADDAQYGLRGIQNNIPQLAFLLGGASGMALAGAAGIGMTAIALLASHWQQLSDAFGFSNTQTEADKMNELAKATRLTFDEAVKLDKYQREKKAGEEGLTALPKAVREDAAKVRETLAEVGAVGVYKGFEQLQVAQAGGRDVITRQQEEELRRRLRSQGHVEALFSGEYWADTWNTMKRRVGVQTLDQQVKVRAEQHQLDIQEAVKADVGRMETDPVWRNKMVAVMQAHPEFFPKGAAEEYKKVSPEALAAERAAKAEKKEDTADAKVRADLQQTLRNALTAEIKRGTLDRDNVEVQEFEAGTRSLGQMSPRARGLILGQARTILGREAAAAGGDPALLRENQAQTKLLEKAVNLPMVPPKPVAGAARAVGRGG